MKIEKKSISWGIIGCGDVAEVKSGPAFQKADHSELLAVMRRDGAKAEDFAKRHSVPIWYDQVSGILDNADINAVYIATPPASHLEYALQSLKAGKHVYLEKPMVLSNEESEILCDAVKASKSKLVVAHYRRLLPMYVKVKELIDKEVVGDIKFVEIRFLQKNQASISNNWRINAEISGGGLFHDLAPHQLDLMYHFFGDYENAKGFSDNQASKHQVVDIVNGIAAFKNSVQFRGIWHFDATDYLAQDDCTIYGSNGKISFSFYGEEVKIESQSDNDTYSFKHPLNIQQPFIQQTVNYFLGEGSNPCSAEEGKAVMAMINAFTK